MLGVGRACLEGAKVIITSAFENSEIQVGLPAAAEICLCVGLGDLAASLLRVVAILLHECDEPLCLGRWLAIWLTVSGQEMTAG